ncbi:MAG: hypothetical protein AVDCRST_MAG03-3816 [uncultured Rubrobacteraceae bacterium]|uniref:Uncharacterized protein n=1 Tax=uncultured Rubrobacteraceae bacterium TaxID=349277 RepID=A0A6J4QJ89_9ACTN|nr:MAG: hypothetical protein AVDCRST_MAG03-3816 [uncultured Rubrobacteraceae bacterium]
MGAAERIGKQRVACARSRFEVLELARDFSLPKEPRHARSLRGGADARGVERT